MKTPAYARKEGQNPRGGLNAKGRAAAKAEGVTLKAMALNDYQTSIPFADTKKFDVVLAHKMNGESIPVKTKGPLFIVYPYDTNKELQSSVYYERSAWQLKSLSIE